MWDLALKKEKDSPYLSGVTINPTTKQPDYLIFSYHAGNFRPYSFVADITKPIYNDIAIPVGNGQISAPFAYTGKARRFRDIKTDLCGEKFETIQRYRFTKDDFKKGTKLKSSSRTIAVYRPTDFGWSEDHRIVVPGPWRQLWYENDKGSIQIQAYHWANETGDFSHPGQSLLDENFDFGANEKIYLFPYTQPKLPEESFLNIMGATIATPWTLILDGPLLPFTWFLAMQESG
jgi:hypothetical protein